VGSSKVTKDGNFAWPYSTVLSVTGFPSASE